MRFEHEGMSLWYERTPGETVAAGTEVIVTVGVEPADASNEIDVLYRTNGEPEQSIAGG